MSCLIGEAVTKQKTVKTLAYVVKGFGIQPQKIVARTKTATQHFCYN